MKQKYTTEELKATFPQSWKYRDQFGTIDEKKRNPLGRDPSTWSEAELTYVQELVKGSADKILNSGQPDRFKQMLIDELQRRKPNSYNPMFAPTASETQLIEDGWINGLDT